MAPHEAIKRILTLDARAKELKELLRVANQERAEIIAQQGQAVAKLSVGDVVTQPYGYGRTKTTRRYQITRIGGWFWSPRRVIEDAFDKTDEALSEGRFEAEYWGKQVRADGSLSDKEKKLYDVERTS